MSDPNAAADEQPLQPWQSRGLLLAILLVALALRVAALTDAPPGLNQDEAANAWNAWCLLHTGRGQAGEAWPILYIRALGENRPALQTYAILPWQALGGLNVWTVRLPSAIAGVLSIALVFYLGRAWCGPRVGLLAAALLAVSPWHVQLSRLGLEAAYAPLLVTGGLAVLVWAGLPLGRPGREPILWRVMLAGLVAGVACYGYAAVRLVLPLLILAGGLVSLDDVRAWLRRPRAAAALLLAAAGFAAAFGPLAYQHVAAPEEIGRRTQGLWVWEPEDTAATRAGKIAWRYAAHFGPDFLFVRGDAREIYSVARFGVLHWYALPLVLAGVVVLVGQARRSAARVLLVWLALYPVGDSLFRASVDARIADELYMLRSAAGLVVFALVAAVGLDGLLGWCRGRARVVLAGAAAVWLSGSVGVFGWRYFAVHPTRPDVYHGFHADLLAACDWLAPRYAESDAVFVTASGMNMPYIVTLVGIEAAPETWFAAERDVRTFDGLPWEYVFRVGKLHFVHDQSALAALAELQRNGRPDRVLFVMRPGEIGLPAPDAVVTGPGGAVQLVLHEVEL
jgi:4-amino-4-deoxy-L-arabinose transferase-like glycosyltransferase